MTMTTKTNKGNDMLAKLLANPETKKLLLAMLEQDKPAKAAKSKPTAKTAPVKVEKVQVVNYSDKAVAVIGNTKPIKDTLKSFGRFNPFLRVNDQVAPGWVVSVKRSDELKKALIELGAL